MRRKRVNVLSELLTHCVELYRGLAEALPLSY
jgi:hypothetical protein